MSYARRWRTRSGRWFLIDRHGWRPVDDGGGEIDLLCGFLTTGLVLAWSWLFLGALIGNSGAGGVAALIPAGIYLLCDHGWPRWITWIVRSILWFGTFAIFAAHWP